MVATELLVFLFHACRCTWRNFAGICTFFVHQIVYCRLFLSSQARLNAKTNWVFIIKKMEEKTTRSWWRSPNKLWCICTRPEDGKFLIQCDEGSEWLHGGCVGLSCSQGLRMEECGEHYSCPLCDPQTHLPILDANQSDTFVWGSGLSSSDD